VAVQTGAGVKASAPDAEYEAAGASIVPAASDVYTQSDIVLKVRAPEASELPLLRRGSILIALLNPHDTPAISALAATGVTAFAMEAVPRITRAQTMDVLSSQANIAGYKAVMLAANEYGRFMPMLMTAAGTVKAARVLVLGAGVAGLQAGSSVAFSCMGRGFCRGVVQTALSRVTRRPTLGLDARVRAPGGSR